MAVVGRSWDGWTVLYDGWMSIHAANKKQDDIGIILSSKTGYVITYRRGRGRLVFVGSHTAARSGLLESTSGGTWASMDCLLRRTRNVYQSTWSEEAVARLAIGG